MTVARHDVSLDPRPIGWFAVARSAELRRGREVGGVLATAPYRLRRLRDGELRFEGSIGAVAEQNGFVFAWHHPGGAPPTWRIPVLDESGWRPMRHELLRARTHPQEVYENSIDTGHFPVIHGYTDISILRPMQVRGHEMDVRYQIARAIPLPVPVPGLGRKIVSDFEVHLHGIGCAHNHIHVPALGLQVRMFALATPTEPGRVDIRLAVSVADGCRLPDLLLPMLHIGVARGIGHDFRQDMAVWEHKRYLRPPLLVKGDGPIEAFRRWSKQFYAATVRTEVE